jgi:glycosyltransferase involved in cell wall biosynthesis
MHVLYVALDPMKIPRIKKIASTLEARRDVAFDVMIPKFRFTYQGGAIGRMIVAAVNYFSVFVQVLLARADLYWVANCPDILAIPLILRRRPYILEYRSPWAKEVEDEFGPGPWAGLAGIIERLALTHARVVTLTSSRLMPRVQEFRRPVFVIPNYPLRSFGTIRVSRSEFKGENGLSSTDRVVLYVGKLTRVEGADMLPRIIEDVLARADANFWIVGSGPLYGSLKAFAAEHANKIRLFGWQPHDRIPLLIASADVCIAPRHETAFSTLYNEEGVTKISEYMFFEKPIVACGVARSDEYLLVEEERMADGIVEALNGSVHTPKRMTWQDHSEKEINRMFNLIQTNVI